MKAGKTSWRLIRAVVLVLGILLPASLIAQERGAERHLSVMDAVREALAGNHEIRSREGAAMAGRNDIGVARSSLLPKIFFEERFSRTTNPGYAFMDKLNQERITQQDFNPDLLNRPDAVSDYQTSFSVEQPLFAQKAFIGLEMSKKEAQARDHELQRKREEVSFLVVKACLMVASAREYVKAAAQGVEDAREHLRVANLRYSNSLGQYADTLRASTALAEAMQRKNVAEKRLGLAKRALGLLLGTTDSIDVTDAKVELPLKDLAFYEEAARSRNDIQAAGLRHENARKGISMAEAGYLPYLGVGGSYQLNDHGHPFGSEGDGWMVSAFLRWDLFDGARREYERARARDLAFQAGEQIIAMKQGISYRIAESYLNVEEARKNLDLSQQALKTSEEGTRLVRIRYENGLSSLADLLSAQASLEQARAGVVDRRNAYDTSLAELSYESGTILKDLNLEESGR
jgi:outer membrane protein TolC